MRKFFYVISFISVAAVALLGLISPWWLLCYIFILPVVALGLYDTLQKSDNVSRNFPLVGRIKQLFVKNRELIQDWILENERDIRPFDRIQRNVVYTRADNKPQTVAFGTRYSYHKSGFEWMLHSNCPSDKVEDDLRIMVGGADCTKPYSCSLLNVSGMSYGSISKNATLALNGGAKLGGFAANTGEGGLTDYHLENGGDVIFQLGTGYFGSRDENGRFSEKIFREKAAHPQVKMVEIKISQGAKPGYGAIMPGIKLTEEIARIRGVKAGITVISPPGHSEFKTPKELMYFMKRLRDASGGKPVGYKFCLGQKHEVFSMCKAMIETGITPDYIAIDDAEGGTGAAHFESADSMGMPLEDAVPFVHDVLKGFGLKKHVRLFVSGKITSGFHIARYLALGADACYSARGMMFAMGCVQALQCDRNTCPTGITTTDESLVRGLVPEDKKHKVFNYHRETLNALRDVMIASGLRHTAEISRSLICRRTGLNEIKTLEEIYPSVQEGCLLKEPIPEAYRMMMAISDANTFSPLTA